MSDPNRAGKHALVFGASGLAGWGVVEQLLSQSHDGGAFRRVTALVNRPMTVADARWSTSASDGPELTLVSGTDLADGSASELATFLRAKVEGVEKVSEVFYFAYKQEWETKEECRINRVMLERVLDAVEQVAPQVRTFVWPSGARSYGIHLPTRPFTAPFTEDMTIPDADAETVFHTHMRRALVERRQGKAWTWSEVRPDAIVGFVPSSNFNLTYHRALYLSLYAHVEGEGARVPYPGTWASWHARFNEASATAIARLAIFCARHPDACGEEVFNVADTARPGTMKERWPQLCAWFGLEGMGPTDEPDRQVMPGEYVKRNHARLDDRGIRWRGVNAQAEFLDQYGFWSDFDRFVSLDKAREKGWTEPGEPVQEWHKAFERFRRAGMIL